MPKTMKTENLPRGAFKTVFGARRRYLTLRMAPMIDIIFLLLIFFLVAAKWRPQEDFLPFRLAAAVAQGHKTIKPEPLTIHIFSTQSGCTVQIANLHNVQIDDADTGAALVVLMEKTKQTLTAQKRFASDPIEIICSADVQWQYPARIYNVLFGAGLTDITFTMTE